MALTGKNTLSLRRKDVAEQKSIAIGFKKVQFAHKATLGATGINLNSLVLPTEMSGFTNPSPAELLEAQLSFYRKNLTLISSTKGVLIDYMSYDVSSSSQINFVGFTADDGEIFTGIIDAVARTGVQLVDAAPLVSTGELAVSTTDFNVGQLFEINKYSSSQVGAVIVYRNGSQQFRNTNNSAVTLDGNYYEVNNGSGTGQVIRFNNAPIGTSDSILVVSNGLMAYNPDGSALQRIEAISGKIDSMVPTVAALAGVPESNFGGVSNVDLKSFGDTVIADGARITALESATYVNGTITFTQTVAADTYIDVTGTTINLPSGQWELVYSGLGYVDNITGGVLSIFGNVVITDSANVIMDNAMALVGISNLASGGSMAAAVHLVARVSGGAYKLRIRCTHAAASGHMSVGPITYTVALTDPDASAKWYARRIGV